MLSWKKGIITVVNDPTTWAQVSWHLWTNALIWKKLICCIHWALEGVDCIKGVLYQMSSFCMCCKAVLEEGWEAEGFCCFFFLSASEHSFLPSWRQRRSQMTLANAAHILQSHSFSSLLLPYWSYVCSLLGRANNSWMPFIAGTITAFLRFLSV